jgi:hypothetical protein
MPHIITMPFRHYAAIDDFRLRYAFRLIRHYYAAIAVITDYCRHADGCWLTADFAYAIYAFCFDIFAITITPPLMIFSPLRRARKARCDDKCRTAAALMMSP